MARIKNNMVLKGVSGTIDILVVKQYSYGAVLSKKPDMSRVKPSRAQKAKRTNFQKAVAYAKSVIRDPKQKAAFAKKLKPRQTVFNAAISSYMKSLLAK